MSIRTALSLGLTLSFITLTGCAPKTDTAAPEPEASAPADVKEDTKDDADADADAEDAKDDADAKAEDKADAKADAKDDAKPAKGGDVLAVLAANPKTRTFSELIPLSDFGKGMHGREGAGFTVLAPSDEAFDKFGKAAVERLKKHPNELDGFIRLHIVLGTNDVNKLTNFRTAPTAAGKDLEVKTQDNDVTVQGARLIETDLTADNGVVHVIDRVIKKK